MWENLIDSRFIAIVIFEAWVGVEISMQIFSSFEIVQFYTFLLLLNDLIMAIQETTMS